MAQDAPILAKNLKRVVCLYGIIPPGNFIIFYAVPCSCAWYNLLEKSDINS
jgi:hypothetical protein